MTEKAESASRVAPNRPEDTAATAAPKDQVDATPKPQAVDNTVPLRAEAAAVTPKAAASNTPEAPKVAAPAPSFRAGPIDVPTVGSKRIFGRFTIISFVLCVLLPFAASCYYFAFVAADRYAVEVKFAIRSPSGGSGSDLLGLVTGSATAGSTEADSYMVIDYLESRQFVEEIAKRTDLEATYATEAADMLSRLPEGASKEDMVAYLPRMISGYFDSTSQIITVETQAFTPEDARKMAEGVIVVVTDLVNKVSERARQDTVRLAETELARAEAALRAQRAALSAFRDAEQKIDPAATAAAQETVLASLQGELSRSLTEMSSLREFLSEDAPSVRVLQSRIDSIRRQIAAERSQVGSGEEDAADAAPMDDTGVAEAVGAAGTADDGSLNSSVTQYEELRVDLEFRQRAYLSAMGSLELARVEADRQQRYLATFVMPSTPEEALYPKAFLSLVLIGVIAFMIWGVLAMFANIVREHVN